MRTRQETAMVPLTFLHGFLGAGTPTPRATPSRNPVPSRRSRHHRMSIQPARRHTRSRITTPATPSPVLEAGELGADRMGDGVAQARRRCCGTGCRTTLGSASGWWSTTWRRYIALLLLEQLALSPTHPTSPTSAGAVHAQCKTAVDHAHHPLECVLCMLSPVSRTRCLR